MFSEAKKPDRQWLRVLGVVLIITGVVTGIAGLALTFIPPLGTTMTVAGGVMAAGGISLAVGGGVARFFGRSAAASKTLQSATELIDYCEAEGIRAAEVIQNYKSRPEDKKFATIEEALDYGKSSSPRFD